jgi:hypothetical protein
MGACLHLGVNRLLNVDPLQQNPAGRLKTVPRPSGGLRCVHIGQVLGHKLEMARRKTIWQVSGDAI